MAITATCVKANSAFTLFDEYSFEFGDDFYADTCMIQSDAGYWWHLQFEGDGYYGCTDIDGKHVSFLVE